ncbi:endopolyphosphatase [Daedalea quercina L-15889]|uniref:Endopolyphosphatase n=1 Tax=Daedalea quercina L-15889 TaxID=1314783 RepID=A0A165U5A7_9APHY|nr:endopolyphosphatase [Daedalea quercina L-15889]
MFGLKLLLFLLMSCAPGVLAAPSQAPMQVPETSGIGAKQKLQGRFLHITDMHPDLYYKADASQKSACHRRKPKKARPRSGYYGMPYSDCDSPLTLTNFTLDYLDKEWSKEIDFVVWTGDNARHDNDRKRPRTTNEIYMLNRAMAKRMEEVFLSKGIPVIPTIGNNDVWPHNIMLPGPNSVTFEFSSIWRNLIPFESYQVFQRGGYFSVEVVPDQLAVVSLNTMYLYDSNKAVGGCEQSDPEDPGNLQFDWLEVQLERFRRRGMQVWLSGHVPPSADNFFPDCFVRYTELSLRYQDTILGHLYGHMNADHFFFLDAEHVRSKRDRNASTSDTFGEPHAEGKKKNRLLYNALLKDFDDLPKAKRNSTYDDYGVVNVSPSVVPSPYLPSFRIFAYNTTGTPYVPAMQAARSSCDDADGRDAWWCGMAKPWHANPESPSRTNRLWTPLGYAQYYLPDLDSANKKHAPKVKLEYLTFSRRALHPSSGSEQAEAAWHPIPLRHLPKSLRNATMTDKGSKYVPYGLADLTIGSWVDLGRRLAAGTEAKLRKRFRRFMYMGGEGA